MKCINLVKFFIVSCIVIQLVSCNDLESQSEVDSMLITELYGDAETVKSFSGSFENDGYEFSGASTQTDSIAHSGKYSIELKKGADFGLGTKIEDVPKGSYAEVSVWRYSTTGKGALHVSSDKMGDLYYLVNKTITTDSTGWQKIVVNVPIDQEIDRLLVTCFSPNDIPVYFDDLRIRIYKSRPIRHDETLEMAIHLTDSNYAKLLRFRKKALDQKVISKDLKKYVKAIVLFNGDSIPVKLRFKGDWTDHLKGDKWSFRIKVGDGYAINGLKSFSIQSPVTRGFLNEWFMHQVFENQGLLTTSYGFVPVKLNGNNLGMYALEEHFDKQLIESRENREGPILKMDEEGFWERNLLYETENVGHNIPFYEASAVLPFKRKRTFKNETLKSEFLIAKNLMYQYKMNKAPIENLFDVEALAFYHALFDLGAVSHGLRWHNQRVYYNPITSKLEPIAYDLYTDDVYLEERDAIKGKWYDGQNDIPRSDFLNQSVFNQLSFQREYIKKLQLVSSPSFLEEEYQRLKPQIDSLNSLLSAEYKGYNFELHPYLQVAQSINEELPSYIQQTKEKSKRFELRHETYDDLTNTPRYYNETGLKVYASKRDTKETRLQLVNFHRGPIQVIGYGVSPNQDQLVHLKTPVPLNSYNGQDLPTELTVEGKASRVFFQLPAFGDSIFSKKVVQWEYPNMRNPRMEIENEIPFSSPHYTKRNREIIFNKNVMLTKIIFIPKGHVVKMEPGTKIVMDANGGIVSYSPIVAEGTQEDPISVLGISSMNNGLQVLTKNDSTIFSHVTFEGLSTLNYKGWSLTGGVTVYKGQVKIDHCVFAKNRCEDALNLVNSSFEISNSTISQTYSDGFDGDFCTGIVSHTKVLNAGNDGLDFSGSVVKINQCEVLSPGDKAVSGGEASTVSVTHSSIRNAALGVVAKDNSKVKVSETEFHFCKNPYAVFQKKDEFGPAFLVAQENQFFETNADYLIGSGCYILDNNKRLDEVNINSVEALYDL